MLVFFCKRKRIRKETNNSTMNETKYYQKKHTCIDESFFFFFDKTEMMIMIASEIITMASNSECFHVWFYLIKFIYPQSIDWFVIERLSRNFFYPLFLPPTHTRFKPVVIWFVFFLLSLVLSDFHHFIPSSSSIFRSHIRLACDYVILVDPK